MHVGHTDAARRGLLLLRRETVTDIYLFRNDDWTPTHWRMARVEFGHTLKHVIDWLLEQRRGGVFPVYVDNELVGTVDVRQGAAIARIEPAAVAKDPYIYWDDVHAAAREWEKYATCEKCGQVSGFNLRIMERNGKRWTRWLGPHVPNRDRQLWCYKCAGEDP